MSKRTVFVEQTAKAYIESAKSALSQTSLVTASDSLIGITALLIAYIDFNYGMSAQYRNEP